MTQDFVMQGARRSGRRPVVAVLGACLVLGACATVDIDTQERTASVPPSAPAPTQSVPPPAPTGKGGYYLDDGPGEEPPPDLDAIPDAVPRVEPLLPGSLRPYTALGNNYLPMTQREPYKVLGVASWYGRRYHGKPTSSGETYDMYKMTAAHTTLPLPSYARVTSLRTGKSVVVRINDRGPFHNDRLIDLSYAAAHRIGIVQEGSGPVEVEAILPEGVPSVPVIRAEPLPPVSPTAAPDATDTPSAPPPSADSGQEYYLQFGAFSSLAGAEEFMRKLRTDYPKLDKPLAIVSGKGLFRVQAGPFPDRDSARREADAAAARTGFRPFPTKR